MLSALLFISFFISSVNAAAAAGFTQTLDLNCTTPDKKSYTSSATGCDNVQADAACAVAYPAGTAGPVSAGGQQDRPAQCYTTDAMINGAFSQDVKNMAIATCPKTCGYCCQTTAYSCTNAPLPRINCATVTSTMCTSALWRTVIAQDCPNVCGFCLLGGCIDAAPDCATQPSICLTRGLETFVATNCQRTCSLCSSTTAGSSATTVAGGTATSSTCGNTNTNCASWVANGFCSSTFYTAAQKRQFCGTSCSLC